jgi:hypothetical protein
MLGPGRLFCVGLTDVPNHPLICLLAVRLCMQPNTWCTPRTFVLATACKLDTRLKTLSR